MRLSEYASTRKTRGSYKMPRSVQQSIPIDRIYADGVWQSENVFSLMWQISDINYAMQSDAAKQNILTQLGTVYAGIPADCWMQVCIVSQRMDEKAFARDVLYHRENDGFDALRAERNRQIKANARENGNVVQHKYIIVSTNKPGVKEARERFVQVQGHLLSAFSALECSVTPLDNRARLEVLHKFFRISEEGRFNFDFDNCAKLGQDFRDSIAPDCIRFCKKHIEIEDFYAKCMTISEYPQQLDDKFISALLQQVPYIVLSIDIEPVETEDAFKEIDNAQMKTDAEKVRFNKKSVENLDFTSSVPQRTQEQDRIIASIRKEMTENDQQMFLSLLTVTYFADTLEDLALETDALKTTAANYNCRFTELYFQQERAFNTAMPYGLRRIESVRTMLTKSLTALVPFNTQEILTPGGICYGRNAVTGNLIIGLRTNLVNGNAMVVATSGGGKSMFVKLEILMLYLRFTKARFYVVDPENEYAPLVQELGGEVVNISVDSATHFNPLDFKYDKATKIPPHVAKAEFVLSLCEQIMGKEHILAGDKSLIDDALENIYKPLMESHYTAPCPTIKDLWMALNNQRDKRSKEIALALRIFATGSMQAFAQPTNVDMSNRLICFNIQSLGEQLKPVAMLSMLEYINTAVMSNERNDPKAATWVYFDEIYLLLRDSLSANFLYTSWKRFRKYNAYATGITETPKTWDEFLTVCQTIKDNGYEPLALDGAYANFNFYNHLVRHLGEDAIAELGKNGGWADNEAAVTAAQEIIDFVNAGYLAEGAPDAYPASQTKVGLGTAAMVVCANYVTSEVDAAVGEPVNWGFFNYPEVEGNVDASAYAGANSLAISSSCENPQAAFDFIMTIVTGTCGQELVDKGGQIPADTRLKESVLAGSVETLKNTTTPMSWCGSLNTLDGWSSIKSSMIELFEGKYATGADYCAYLDTLCG